MGLDNGLEPKRWQGIIWTSAAPIHWHIYVALGEMSSFVFTLILDDLLKGYVYLSLGLMYVSTAMRDFNYLKYRFRYLDMYLVFIVLAGVGGSAGVVDVLGLEYMWWNKLRIFWLWIYNCILIDSNEFTERAWNIFEELLDRNIIFVCLFANNS